MGTVISSTALQGHGLAWLSHIGGILFNIQLWEICKTIFEKIMQ